MTFRLTSWMPGLLCLVLALGHGLFAWENRFRRPEIIVMSPPPGEQALEALALGDRQFLYRMLALQLQDTGDEGGRVTPIRNYNFDYVMGWLGALARLDPQSHDYLVLALRYFAFTPDNANLRRLVDFVVADASRDPARKWYWLTQAVETADHRLGDHDYALRIARQLAAYEFPLPSWVWLFPAVLLQKMGRFDEARTVMEDVRRTKAGRLERETLTWMDGFERGLGAP